MTLGGKGVMEEINLMEVIDYFRGKFIWIIASILVAIIIGNIYTMVTRVPLYKSNTSVVLVNQENTTTTLNDVTVNKNLVSTYSEIIKSRKILEQVIKNLKLDYEVSQLSKQVTVTQISDTEIIKIEVSDENAERAKNITNEIAKVFTKEIKDIYNLENVSVVDKAVKAESAYNLTYVKDNIIYFAIGLVLSCGIIFIIYYFDTTIKSTEVIEEKLGLTVLGVVPEERRVR